MKKIWCIFTLVLIVIALAGCQINKSEITDASGDERKTGDVVKVENGEINIEQAVRVFCGMELKEIQKYNEDGNRKDSISCHKGKFGLSYVEKSREGLGPVFIYEDAAELAGERYMTTVEAIFGSIDDVVDCRMRKLIPDEGFPDCEKKHILGVCNPCAEALGYTSENSMVDCYAVSADMMKKKGEEIGLSGPIPEIQKLEDYSKLSQEKRTALEKKSVWRDTDRVVYVVYRPVINGRELSSTNENLHMIYQPDRDKVVYAQGLAPWKIVSIEKKDGMISEQEAIASAKTIKQVRGDSDVQILGTELLYSQDFTVLRKNWTLSLCYRVNMKLLNRKDKKGNEAYCTALVDAFTGERVQMWPGLGE